MKIRNTEYTKKEMAAHNGVDTRFWENKLPDIENVPEGWENHMHTQQFYRKRLNLDELHVEYRKGILVCVFDVSKEEADFLQLEYVKKYEDIGWDGDAQVPICKETGEFELRKGSYFVDNEFRCMRKENPVAITSFSFGLAITKYFMREPREMSIPVYTEREFDYFSRCEHRFHHGTLELQAAIIRIRDSKD